MTPSPANTYRNVLNCPRLTTITILYPRRQTRWLISIPSPWGGNRVSKRYGFYFGGVGQVLNSTFVRCPRLPSTWYMWYIMWHVIPSLANILFDFISTAVSLRSNHRACLLACLIDNTCYPPLQKMSHQKAGGSRGRGTGHGSKRAAAPQRCCASSVDGCWRTRRRRGGRERSRVWKVRATLTKNQRHTNQLRLRCLCVDVPGVNSFCWCWWY